MWTIIRRSLGIIGGVLMFGGAGTSDFYTMELRQPDPDYAWYMIGIGILLLLPSLIHWIKEDLK